MQAKNKLCARSLAGRLLRVIHHVVDANQTCGVPGRFIGENVSLLRDLVSYTSESGTSSAILSLDQEKAFDSADWLLMSSTPQGIGFVPFFIRWVCLLYSNVRSSVLFNGYSSPVFFLSRGVRQGLSALPTFVHSHYGGSRCQPQGSSPHFWYLITRRPVSSSSCLSLY